MRELVKRAGNALKTLFEEGWNYLGSLAAVSLFSATLGLGIYHAAVQDKAPRYYCYSGVYNPAGADVPRGICALGEETSPGIPHVRLEYDEQGKLRRMKSVNAQGRLCALPGSQVAEQRVTYDESGHVKRRENLNAVGKLAEDAQGVAVREFEHSPAGHHVLTRFYNAKGERVSPRFPGYAEQRIHYDAAGRPLEIIHLGADAQPAPNAIGEELVKYHYADDGRVTRRNLVKGKTADNVYGVAVEELLKNEQHSCRRWKNAAGRLVIHPLVGAAPLQNEQHAAAGVGRCCYLQEDGTPISTCRACAEQLVHYNNHGLIEWEYFCGADGLPVNHAALGYAERTCEYTHNGHLKCEHFRDETGNPAPLCEKRHIITHAGRYALSLHLDGSTSIHPEHSEPTGKPKHHSDSYHGHCRICLP